MQKFLKEWAPVIALMLLAGVLRFYELGSWPPGLYHDEAYNGLDALRVLAGEHPLYFAANHGREPLFIYLVALSVSWLGRSVYAVRLPAAVVGTLLIPATYWMARGLFSRRVALLTAAIMTITVWPIHLSLIGLRAGTLPLFIALSIGAGVRAYRSGRTLHWIGAGLFYGLSFYTYLASRFTPFALLLIFIVVLFLRRDRRLWRGSLVFAIAAAIALIPLAVAASTEWDVVMGRPGDVSIFNPAINQGDPIGALIRSTFGALGLFFWRGDRIPRHNIPYRPVFDPFLVIFFGLGLIRLIVAAVSREVRPQPLPDFLQPGQDFKYPVRQHIAPLPKLHSLFTLIWIGVMLLPTILAEDSPHFLRAVGVLPMAMLIPAIGLNTVAAWLEARSWKALSYLTLAIVLIVSLVWSVRDYSRYAVDPETAHWFESAGVDLAQQARAEIQAGQRVYVADRFARDWASVPFLIGGVYQAVPDHTPPALTPQQPATLFVWPYEDWASSTFAAITTPQRINVASGPPAEGDNDRQPHVGFLRVRLEPPREASAAPEAVFENGLRLLGHSVEAIDDQHWRLRTLWQTDRPQSGDQTFFAHLLMINQLLAAKDGDSGGGFYPMTMWRVGDVIVDERIFEVPPQADRNQLLVELGVYDRATGERVKVTQATPPIVDNAILLSGPTSTGPNAAGP